MYYLNSIFPSKLDAVFLSSKIDLLSCLFYNENRLLKISSNFENVYFKSMSLIHDYHTPYNNYYIFSSGVYKYVYIKMMAQWVLLHLKIYFSMLFYSIYFFSNIVI